MLNCQTSYFTFWRLGRDFSKTCIMKFTKYIWEHLHHLIQKWNILLHILSSLRGEVGVSLYEVNLFHLICIEYSDHSRKFNYYPGHALLMRIFYPFPKWGIHVCFLVISDGIYQNLPLFYFLILKWWETMVIKKG